MKSIYACALFCLVAGSVLADQKQDSMNKLADQILGGILKSQDLNPLKLHQDYEQDIHEDIGPIPLEGHIKISKGLILGFNSLQRTGNCKIASENGVMKVNIELITNDEVVLDADISGTIGRLLHIPALPIVAHIGNMNFDIGLEVGANITLSSFDINEISEVHLRFKDAQDIKFFDNIIDFVTKGILKLFNEQLIDALDKTIRPILKNELKYIHL
ncbi:hypothetical protein BLA29_006326 [Euroglyphus maynei]|uniref:Uncharacterized protein n=1 Tax=Euroglyphus maynei TaxID=6958 RepID=A0A1Y3BSV1_EURMA|nr:hypothetical protein BLA29_006326 [Euroglyphus maynei]